MDRASATETVDTDSILGGVKPKAIKIWHSQLPYLTFSNKKGQCEASTVCGRQLAG